MSFPLVQNEGNIDEHIDSNTCQNDLKLEIEMNHNNDNDHIHENDNYPLGSNTHIFPSLSSNTNSNNSSSFISPSSVNSNPLNSTTDPIQYPLVGGKSNKSSNLNKKNIIIPTPLNLPKKFNIENSQSSDRLLNKDIKNSNKDSKNNSNQISNLNSSNQQDMTSNNLQSQFIHYYNPIVSQQLINNNLPIQQQITNQSRPIISLPLSAPPLTNYNLQFQQQPQPIYLAQPTLYQIVYSKASNGQIIPLISPVNNYQPQFYNSNINDQNLRNNNSNTNNPNSSNTNDISNKRQKTSSTSLTNDSIKMTELLQKQQISRQMKIYPNLNKELKVPNISDIFESNYTSNINSLSGSEEILDNDLEIKPNKDQELDPTSDNVSNISPTSSSTSNQDNLDNKALLNPQLQFSKIQKCPKKIIGTVSLGSFTYKYSQTLSGDSVKDRELFDRLTDNAWKSCISKQ